MSQTVAVTLVDTLEKIGVPHIFGLISDSTNSIADAVRHSNIERIGVRYEEGAALAAAGQAKLTGRLGVCCGSTGPGSNHLVAGPYEASHDLAPDLPLSRDIPRKTEGTDYFRATDPNMLFRDVALYTETISSSAQAPAIIQQAIAAAYAGRGVARLTPPQDVSSARAEVSVSSLATLEPRSEIVAAPPGAPGSSRDCARRGRVVHIDCRRRARAAIRVLRWKHGGENDLSGTF